MMLLARLLIVFGFTLTVTEAVAQKVFIASTPTGADVKVFVESSKELADLCVYQVEYSHQTRANNGLWFTALHEKLCDVKVYFTDRKSESDMTIFYVKKQSEAGWRNPTKRHLFD